MGEMETTPLISNDTASSSDLPRFRLMSGRGLGGGMDDEPEWGVDPPSAVWFRQFVLTGFHCGDSLHSQESRSKLPQKSPRM